MTEKKSSAHDFPRGVAQPAIRALESVGITRLEQCAKFSESELGKLHGMGPKALRIIREELKARGKYVG